MAKAKKKPRKKRPRTVEVPDGEGWTRTVEVPSEQRTIPNPNLNKLSWKTWTGRVIDLLGFLPKADGVTNEQHLFSELAVSRDKAVSFYNSSFAPETFVNENEHYKAAPRHDHTNGTSNCRLCQLEKTLPREGGVPWDQWCRQLLEALGSGEIWDPSAAKMHLGHHGIDIKDAMDYWSRNFTPEGFLKLKRLKHLIHLNDGDDNTYCGAKSDRLTAAPDETTCKACREALRKKESLRMVKLGLPDATVEVVLTTREVLSSIERWAEACRTGKINGSKRSNTVRDLVYEIQSEVEDWINVLEEDGR
jgi:hypothetical protein